MFAALESRAALLILPDPGPGSIALVALRSH